MNSFNLNGYILKDFIHKFKVRTVLYGIKKLSTALQLLKTWVHLKDPTEDDRNSIIAFNKPSAFEELA